MTDLIDVAPLSVNEHERAALRDFAHTLDEECLTEALDAPQHAADILVAQLRHDEHARVRKVDEHV
mgnify:CR=1 FL=1